MRTPILMIVLVLLLGITACDLTDSPEFTEESRNTEWLLVKKELEANNSLRILEMYVDKDDVYDPCPEPDCQSILDEIFPTYQQRADSLCKTIHFGFQCCDEEGIITVVDAVVIPKGRAFPKKTAVGLN